jgi:hypothetical protein
MHKSLTLTHAHSAAHSCPGPHGRHCQPDLSSRQFTYPRPTKKEMMEPDAKAKREKKKIVKTVLKKKAN